MNWEATLAAVYARGPRCDWCKQWTFRPQLIAPHAGRRLCEECNCRVTGIPYLARSLKMTPKPDPIPRADWSSAWATLRGYVQEAVADGKPLIAADVATYMDELRSKALRPVGEWIAAAIDRKAAAREDKGESSA